MSNPTSVTIRTGDKDIIIETGLMAKQAGGSVTVRLGDTMLLSAATRADKPREGIDYFPLQVEYRERFAAAGRFPGGFFKRESKPAEKETLTSRLTDRPLRPLFPRYYRNEVQILNTLLSADAENDSDILSITAASAALTISEIPFMGPIAGVRIGRVDGQLVVNPTNEQRVKSDLDLIYAGTADLPLMIEGSAREIGESDLVAAMKIAHAECLKLIKGQLELRKKLGLPDKLVEEAGPDTTVIDSLRIAIGSDLGKALTISDKLTREARINEIKETGKQALFTQMPEMTDEQYRSTFDDLEIEVVRRNVLENGVRIDGRGFRDIRTLAAQVGILPRTHGSALFSRGETQALCSVTLGTKSDSQGLDAITGGEDEKRFMLHYNFPPYCTGEVGRIGFTGRREIGHGALAERSLREVVPADYGYVVRLVSDIMGSNGSSSMASICVGTLAMMDAGVPITKPVAGISVGLFTAPGKSQLVTDILGAEDHCGDMDFKVAGTRDGVTGFQVDLKIRGLEWNLVETAFAQAKEARLKLLDYMLSVIPEPRKEMSRYAPKIQKLSIPVDKIGELIGPGGKNIRRITEMSGAQIDIEEDGTVNIFAVNADSMDIAVHEVSLITAEAQEGEIYDGVVSGIKEFGAFVEILPGKDGLVHISEMADFRVNRVEDICKVGDRMWVKCIGIDDRGRIKLSRRQAMKEKGAASEEDK